jgi:hypothetical protein
MESDEPAVGAAHKSCSEKFTHGTNQPQHPYGSRFPVRAAPACVTSVRRGCETSKIQVGPSLCKLPVGDSPRRAFSVACLTCHGPGHGLHWKPNKWSQLSPKKSPAEAGRSVGQPLAQSGGGPPRHSNNAGREHRFRAFKPPEPASRERAYLEAMRVPLH